VSTEKSKGNKHFVSDDLLDILVQEYMEASGTHHKSQKDLLKQDPDTIKNNMLAAHGMGHMLLNILTRIPIEMVSKDPKRAFVYSQLTGVSIGSVSDTKGGSIPFTESTIQNTKSQSIWSRLR